MSEPNPGAVVPLPALFETPAGLPLEWIRVFRVFADAIQHLTTFFSLSDSPAQPLETLTAWRDEFHRDVTTSREINSHLHGRAPKMWKVGLKIESVLSTMQRALSSAINATPLRSCFLDSTRRGSFEKELLGEIRTFNGSALLDALAEAVVSECDASLSLSLPEDPKTAHLLTLIDQLLDEWDRTGGTEDLQRYPSGWQLRCGGKLVCSPTFEEVRRGQERFYLTRIQAMIINYMVNCWEKNQREFTTKELLNKAATSATNLRDCFRSNGKPVPAWKRLIVPIPKKRAWYTVRVDTSDSPL